jgi:hypothetical protein
VAYLCVNIEMSSAGLLDHGIELSLIKSLLGWTLTFDTEVDVMLQTEQP